MNKNASVKAGRAIASTMVKRYTFIPLCIVAIASGIVLITSTILIFQSSPWWLLLATIFFLWFWLAAALAAVSFFISRALSPRKLSHSEHKQVTQFVKKFTARYAATQGAKKSPAAISTIIAWKYMRGRGKKSITEIVTDPIDDMKELKDGFQKIKQLF